MAVPEDDDDNYDNNDDEEDRAMMWFDTTLSQVRVCGVAGGRRGGDDLGRRDRPLCPRGRAGGGVRQEERWRQGGEIQE